MKQIIGLIIIAIALFGSIGYDVHQNNVQEQRYLDVLLEVEQLGAFRPSNYVGKLLTRLEEGGSETTFNTTPGTAADGTSLTTAKLGDFMVFTINPGASNEEKISASAVSVSGSTATWTVITRGLSFTENAQVTANIKQHSIGETVIISNDDHYLSQQFVNVDDNQTIAGQKTFTLGALFSTAASSTNECDASTEYCTKDYIDNSVNQGAATSTESNGGIVELATALEVGSSTPTTANIPYVLQAQNATTTPQSGCGSGYSGVAGAACVVVADLTGKIRQAWIDLTESFTVTGDWVFNGGGTATTTFNRGVDIDADADTPVILNGQEYTFQAVSAASSTVLSNDGSGGLTFNTITQLVPTTVQFNTSTTTDESVNDTDTETTIGTGSLGTVNGGSLGTNGVLHGVVHINTYTDSGANTSATLRMKLGGTTVCSVSLGTAPTANGDRTVEFRLLNDSSESSQVCISNVELNGESLFGESTSSVDTSSDQEVSFTFQWVSQDGGDAESATVSAVAAYK